MSRTEAIVERHEQAEHGPARHWTRCAACNGRSYPRCMRCNNTGAEPDRPTIAERPADRLHAYAQENAAAHIRDALIWACARRADIDHVSRSLAAAIAVNATKSRAQLVMIAARFVDAHAESCVTAFVDACAETAKNLHDIARRADGAERREKEREARVLEALAERLEG